MSKPLYVHAEWDEAAQVWVAANDAVPGLAIGVDSKIELRRHTANAVLRQAGLPKHF